MPPPSSITMLAQVQKDPDSEVFARPISRSLYRRMLGYARAYPLVVRVLLVAVVLRAIQVTVIEYVFSAILSGPITNGHMTGLMLAVAGYFALCVFTAATLYHRSHKALMLGEGIVHDLRGDVFTKVQSMTMAFFSKTKIGRIISRVTSDAEAVRMGVQDAVFIGIVAGGQILVALPIMAYADAPLFLVVLLTAPFYAVTFLYFRGKLLKANREMQESYSRLTANLAETVSGIRVTQGFVRQDENARLWGDLVLDHEGFNINAARAGGTFEPALEMLNALVVAAILIVGGWQLLQPDTTTGIDDLILFYFLISNVLGPISALGRMYTVAVNSMAGAERVFKLLDREPDFVDDADAIDLPPIDGRIEFKDLGFEYEPGKPVLKEINFIARPGQTVALVGHTGSGKTSIINLISKFYLPTVGQLLIDGREIRKVKSDSLHRQMGIVLQVNFLFTGTVMDNIRIGRPTATDEEVRDAARKLDCVDLIEALPDGFLTVVGERGSGLSLGQRQIICFARAMLADPRIMILDEATSSVDTMTEMRIQKALAILLTGRTSFVVAHRLSTIRHADVVLVLDHGRIVERGTHNDLLATGGVYANLYQQFARAGQA